MGKFRKTDPRNMIQCKVCDEWMPADLGKNKVPWHIRKGTISKCPGSKGSPQAYEGS